MKGSWTAVPTGRSRSVKAEQAEDPFGDLVDEAASAMRRDGLID